VELEDKHPIFVGFKMDGTLRRTLHSVTGANAKYVSSDDSSFLMICRLGKDEYVGKVIRERLSTDRVDDVRRNVLSILQRLCPDIRLPQHLEILVCSEAEDRQVVANDLPGRV
jgi:hypothetical protein